jgi:aminotransferase
MVNRGNRVYSPFAKESDLKQRRTNGSFPISIDSYLYIFPLSEPLMLSQRVSHFTESVIRETTRLAQKFGAINLGQGMPDFDPVPELKEAACRAIQEGFNQYAVTWGIAPLRQAIAQKMQKFNGLGWVDADAHITVCCGATECMMAAMMAVVDPGDEVVIFEPFYENYGPDALLTGAKPVFVKLHPPHWNFDPDELRRAFSAKTKAIIINTPNNPTGKVFTREELSYIGQLCQEFDALALSDEIYEYIQYTDRPHVSIASLPRMAERTVTISGLSKTFSITGWRLGYCVAPEGITSGIRKAHDFLTVGAPHPLQVAGATAIRFAPEYYEKLRNDYFRRRELFLPYLREAGFRFHTPDGAYYVMSDISDLGGTDDVAFVQRMIETVKVAAVPGSSFYNPKESGQTQIRFMFAKKDETLREAGERLVTLRKKL